MDCEKTVDGTLTKLAGAPACRLSALNATLETRIESDSASAQDSATRILQSIQAKANTGVGGVGGFGGDHRVR